MKNVHQSSNDVLEDIGQDVIEGAEAGFHLSRKMSTTADGQGLVAWFGSVTIGTALGAVYGLYRGVKRSWHAPAIKHSSLRISPRPWGEPKSTPEQEISPEL